jgi:predicted GTPase
MAYGAGWVAAQRYASGPLVDPRESAVGSIRETLAKFKQLREVLPAMGYSESQRAELKESIESSGAEVVLNASPADVGSLLNLSIPVVQVRYRFAPREGVDILARVRDLLGRQSPGDQSAS